MVGYKTNIEQQTLDNTNYRKVLFTGKKLQLVVMSLKPQEEIDLETHHNIDQFVRVERGQAYVKVGSKEYILEHDDVIIIPAGKEHYVKNTGEEDLKLYSIYADPEHEDGTVHKTKEESDADEHHHHH